MPLKFAHRQKRQKHKGSWNPWSNTTSNSSLNRSFACETIFFHLSGLERLFQTENLFSSLQFARYARAILFQASGNETLVYNKLDGCARLKNASSLWRVLNKSDWKKSLKPYTWLKSPAAEAEFSGFRNPICWAETRRNPIVVRPI